MLSEGRFYNRRQVTNLPYNCRAVAISFAPIPQDVERYRSLRALNKDLNHRMIKTIPREAYDQIGDAIGFLHRGILVFDSPDMGSVLMDCCLYDWYKHGKNLVQRYSETHPAKPGTDESYLLSACVKAKYRVLIVQSTVPGAGVHCHDALNNEDLFVMDLALSRSLPDGAALATRTIPLGEFSMTGGAGLPIHSKKAVLKVLSDLEAGSALPFKGPDSIALLIVRACLVTGAADHVTHEVPEPKSSKSRRAERWRKFRRYS
jgi:hypothetical protein